ncbi:50S ribosomal protein L3 glutamine methyltransferase [Sinobacterium norvegicum]|uniref:50S ribosomal protein L3 glutamine methyltransferase n=1 Tax=Sinobacterium norvegicum TaxID=1641715 RepID=A0ABM9ABQ3_9GAMM|nr:50S ribosomal protein L3 N(5)-glutamine methyltransferase [Sinobacterium norvegicum]CAH0990630.1 50S ribosomal protein L3 glutamine methyltransferase [Sinobacterium norvegicum]
MQQLQQVAEQLSQLKDYIRWGTSQFEAAGIFYGQGIPTPWEEATILAYHALHLPAHAPVEFLDCTLTMVERQQILSLYQRRVEERIPVAYLVGKAVYAGIEFLVDARVIVPRSPIAEMIEAQFQPWLGEVEVERILDLCAGSGCIGMVCAAHFPEAQVDLLELSDEAIEIAEKNIAHHHLQQQVIIHSSNVFSALQPDIDRFDIIVTNPPYVDMADIASMPAEYHHEPAMALGSGDDGLDITVQILAQASDYLTADGILVVEVGNSGEQLEELFPAISFDWVEFERGGFGVFVMNSAELEAYKPMFEDVYNSRQSQ